MVKLLLGRLKKIPFNNTVLIMTGIVTCVIGCLVMLGWLTRTNFLIQFLPQFAPVQFNTGLSFCLIGLAQILYVYKSNLPRVMGFIVILISFGTLIEYIFSVNLNIDNLFVYPHILVNTTLPGRMAPNTALNLLIIGVILLRHPKNTSNNYLLFELSLSLFLILSGITALFGYIANIPTTYGWGQYAQMAVITAFLLMIIGFGFVIYFGREIHLTSRNKKILLPLGISVLGAFIFMLLWQALIVKEHQDINITTKDKAYYIKDLFQTKLYNYILAANRMQYRLDIGAYSSLGAWEDDADQYINDVPAISAFALTGNQKNSVNGSSAYVFRSEKDKLFINNCLSKPITSSIFIKSYLEKDYKDINYYYCLSGPIKNKKTSYLSLLFNFETLFSQLINGNSQLSGYSIEISDNNKTIFQSSKGYDISNRKDWAASLNIDTIGAKFQLVIWPTADTIRHAKSIFPIISLITSLIITLLLSYVIRMFQRVNEHKMDLKSSEAKLKKVLDTTSDCILIIGLDGKVVLSNKSANNLLEYQRDELLGKSIVTFIPEHLKSDYEKLHKLYVQKPHVLHMGFTNDLSIKTKNGTEIPIDIALNPIEMDNKKYILCSIHDISKAKIIEKKLLENSRSMKVMVDVINAISRESEFDVALQHCITIICTSLGWPVGHVYFINEKNSDELVSSDIWYIHENDKYEKLYKSRMDTTFTYGIGIPGRVLATDAVILLTDVNNDKSLPFSELYQSLGIQSALGFPIKVNGKIIGVFELFSNEKKQESNIDLLVIEILSSQINRFLEYQEIQQSNKKLALRFKLAVSSGKIGIWEFDFSKNTLIWDEEMFKLYGVNSDTFKGHYEDWEALVHPDDKVRVSGNFKNASSSKAPFYYEFRIITPHGETKYIHADGAVITQERNTTAIGVNWDITQEKLLTLELKELNDRLTKYAYFDTLTGLMNRHAFKDAASRIILQAKRHKFLIAVLFVDLDRFKQVNDMFGHAVGDELLKITAKMLSSSLRGEDVICRMGGDEFCIILNDLKSEADAEYVAKKIIASISDIREISNHPIDIGASVGISFYSETYDNLEQLINNADTALLKAKTEGKGCFKVYKE